MGAYLILSDAWYPGWTATVDGEPAEVLRANGLFRAVRLPLDSGEVVFEYQGQMVRIGDLALSPRRKNTIEIVVDRINPAERPPQAH